MRVSDSCLVDLFPPFHLGQTFTSGPFLPEATTLALAIRQRFVRVLALKQWAGIGLTDPRRQVPNGRADQVLSADLEIGFDLLSEWRAC